MATGQSEFWETTNAFRKISPGLATAFERRLATRIPIEITLFMGGKEVMGACGMDMDKDTWEPDEFTRVRLPITITCAGCKTQVPFSKAMIEATCDFWCFDCAWTIVSLSPRSQRFRQAFRRAGRALGRTVNTLRGIAILASVALGIGGLVYHFFF